MTTLSKRHGTGGVGRILLARGRTPQAAAAAPTPLGGGGGGGVTLAAPSEGGEPKARPSTPPVATPTKVISSAPTKSEEREDDVAVHDA